MAIGIPHVGVVLQDQVELGPSLSHRGFTTTLFQLSLRLKFSKILFPIPALKFFSHSRVSFHIPLSFGTVRSYFHRDYRWLSLQRWEFIFFASSRSAQWKKMTSPVTLQFVCHRQSDIQNSALPSYKHYLHLCATYTRTHIQTHMPSSHTTMHAVGNQHRTNSTCHWVGTKSIRLLFSNPVKVIMKYEVSQALNAEKMTNARNTIY